ncbi:hypothetical protein PVAG01_10493 [Phlyctema vagabunda]|uniref:Extracellular serine-rich protein n=1 Tax=Phlyctema vagabunda TaxID=108571 RepID=A0ABR4P2F4_9HELO
MKYQVPSILVALAAGSGVSALALPVNLLDLSGLKIPIVGSVVNSAAYEVFSNVNTPVLNLADIVSKRQDAEPSPDRNVTTPENVFILQCLDAGFRGDCQVFGAPPGQCVSYFDFQSGNDTSVSDKWNDAITSLSTNSGGSCQFYKFQGCNDKGDDRGLSSSYNYNLGVALPDDPRTVDFFPSPYTHYRNCQIAGKKYIQKQYKVSKDVRCTMFGTTPSSISMQMRLYQSLIFALSFLSISSLAQIADEPIPIITIRATPGSSSAPARETHTIAVGAQGHKFTPSFIQAQPGDVVSFRFYPLNHSVARAAFGQPCIPYEYTGINHVGFWSGFKPVAVVLSDPPVYNLLINDTDPIFFYCFSPGACQDGMVGAINPNATQAFDAQHDQALEATLALSPGEYFEPEVADSDKDKPAASGTTTHPDPTSTAGVPSHTQKSPLSKGAIIGIAIGALAGLLLAGAIFYLCGRQRSMHEYIASHGHMRERHHSIQAVRYPNKEYEGTVEQNSPIGQAISYYAPHPTAPADVDPPGYPGPSPVLSSRQNAFTDVHPAFHDLNTSSPLSTSWAVAEDTRRQVHELDDSSQQQVLEQRPMSFIPGNARYVQRGHGDTKAG